MNNYASIIAAIVSFVVTTAMGFPLIPFLKKLKYGQTILDDGPNWHKSKEGTPTMGGIMIASGVVLGVAVSLTVSSILESLSDKVAGKVDPIEPVMLFAGIAFALVCGFIGFIDDYIKVVKKQNLGLTARQKTILQLLATVAYLATLAIAGLNTTWIPFIGDVDITSGFGLIFWPIALVFIYYMVNAVNLTDGIDGLASSVTVVVCCAFLLIAARVSQTLIGTFAAAAAGACVGFILWNAKPAKVFMGDTGSMFLGGTVVALAFGCGKPILLIFAGIIYILEALSVVLQVSVYKLTGKRIFKMSPIHHHFELCQWSEDKICLVFSTVTFFGCLLAALPVYLNW